MSNIKIDLENTLINFNEMMVHSEVVEDINGELEEKAKDNTQFCGWIHLPTSIDKEEFGRIKNAAEKIQSDSDVLVVIGIGGSYLGARAVIEALHGSLYLQDNSRTHVVFVGNNLSPNYIHDVIEFLENKDFSLNVISKSGTTTEPAIAFRIFREILENKYGIEEAKKRIYVTTDKEKGALKKLATNEGYETFVIPDDVGGRFSVLTAVGLLPIAASGLDIDQLIEGAKEAEDKYSDSSLKYNECYQYAVARNMFYDNGKSMEILVGYEPKLHYFVEWWKQLFGESEGKDGKGLFPAGVDFTTDLHSLGQYIQDGQRLMFETVLNIEHSEKDLIINHDENDLDQLNYLEGKQLSFVNDMARQGTIKAHVDGGVPNIVINVTELNEKCMGELIYFFEKACGMSAELLEVNPFNQPGVEKYKTNMFKLLKKPGYEE